MLNIYIDGPMSYLTTFRENHQLYEFYVRVFSPCHVQRHRSLKSQNFLDAVKPNWMKCFRHETFPAETAGIALLVSYCVLVWVFFVVFGIFSSAVFGDRNKKKQSNNKPFPTSEDPKIYEFSARTDFSLEVTLSLKSCCNYSYIIIEL